MEDTEISLRRPGISVQSENPCSPGKNFGMRKAVHDHVHVNVDVHVDVDVYVDVDVIGFFLLVAAMLHREPSCSPW
jgi:hypothetical protein